MKEFFKIIEVENRTKKSAYTEEILQELPEWFADKAAVADYAKEAEQYLYWAAMDENGRCVGFFSAKIHYGHTGEIVVCGVLPKFQHGGIGKTLYNKVESYFIKNNCKFVIVKTLSETAESEPYEQTRQFYKSLGFEPLITLTEMWNVDNPCLIMMKILE